MRHSCITASISLHITSHNNLSQNRIDRYIHIFMLIFCFRYRILETCVLDPCNLSRFALQQLRLNLPINTIVGDNSNFYDKFEIIDLCKMLEKENASNSLSVYFEIEKNVRLGI